MRLFDLNTIHAAVAGRSLTIRRRSIGDTTTSWAQKEPYRQ